MMRKTRQLLAMFVTLVLVFGSLPFQGLAYASNAAAGGNTEGMHEELTPEGATGSGSQKPGSGNEQLALTEENAEEGGKLLEEGVTPSGNLSVQNTVTPNSTSDTEIDNIVLSMPLEDKIAQMIIPAIRTWNGENVQNLDDYPELAKALRAHKYGGIILYATNISTVEQTGNLVNALQANNVNSSLGSTRASIPYLMCTDGEGGLVVRFSMGTRMTGSMAVGATGANAEANAYTTGKVLGEELAALGFAADLAPTIDVNSNPSNPVIGTRSFGDDPNVVGPLGVKFAEGLSQSKVIATYKHFPGHGDTSTDSHIGTPSVDKTKEELEACELIPFKQAINSGVDVDMIMTAHITLPKYDDEVTFADGTTTGYYPATMSNKVINTLLRGQLNYDGVVITDALEMDALYDTQLVDAGSPGADFETKEDRIARLKADPVYCANLAKKIISAGSDILLVPTDLKDPGAADFYSDYVDIIAGAAESDTQLATCIDNSVKNILKLKRKCGILNAYTPVNIERAKAVLGSAEHHADEMKIAREAITLVKNDGYTLPLSGHDNNVVIMGRLKDECTNIAYGIEQLKQKGLIAQDAYVNNLAAGSTSGNESSKMHVTIDYYYDSASKQAHYTDDLKNAIANAKTVLCTTASYGATTLASTSPLYQSVSRAINETHAAGGKFVLLAENLPYDAARYQDADAIMLSYMAAGLAVDPTERGAGANAYNANLLAATYSMFDDEGPTGTLPVNIYSCYEKPDQTIDYNMNEVLYARGLGLNYEYAFVKGANGNFDKGSGKDLAFQDNARFDRLAKVLVDGEELSADKYTAAVGSTNISLKASYLEGLAAGEHKLTAVHEYGEHGGTKEVTTNFTVTGSTPEPGPVDPTPPPAIPVTYDAHCQDYGWNAPSGKDGSTAGTTGESKRLEAMKIKVQGDGIEYRAHVQDIGWESAWAKDGAESGTTNQSKRIEAIQVRLRDDLVNKGYHVWYRVHSQDYGWLGWAKDGDPAGTASMSKRVEAYEAIVLNGDQKPRNYDAAKAAFLSNVGGNAHVQNIGWTGEASRSVFGTTGQALRLEALGLKLAGLPFDGDIEYCLHVQNAGWENTWGKNGDVAGTTGKGMRAEAVRIQLKGDVAAHMNVWYRVHSQDYGWSGWAKDGDPAGTTGLAKRAEAVEVLIQSKDAAAPGSTDNALREG